MARTDEQIVADCLNSFAELQTYRNLFAVQWEEVAELIWPEYRNTFFYGTYNMPGEKKTQRQVDATGMLALSRFGSILDSMLTPQNAMWHNICADDDRLMKRREVQLYFDRVNTLLWKHRYDPHANFASQNQAAYMSVGAFGNGIIYPDEYEGHDGGRGLRYRHIPIGEMFFKENFQGQVDGYIRWFRLTPRQAMQWFGVEVLPEAMTNRNNSEQKFDFIQCVEPNKEYDPGNPGHLGKIYSSYYISLTGNKLCKKGGYHSFPCAITRYTQINGIEVYGRGPAMQVLPSLKTLNAQKTDHLIQAEIAANPVYLTTDQGIVDWKRRPGALNSGGLDAQGNPLIKPLEHGDYQIAVEMLEEEKKIIEGAFLIDLFKILLDDPKIYTATQVVEMISQRGILMAPTIGRQQSEYLGPLIDRELDILNMTGILPPMPDALREAQGDYKIVYTSPMAKSMRAGEAAGFNRVLEQAIQVAQVTGDPSIFDKFDFDVIFSELGEINSVPAHWLADQKKIDERRAQRAQAQQAQQLTQAGPAAAAIMSAQAKQAQAGIGGQGG
jgi:hypothetical protein